MKIVASNGISREWEYNSAPIHLDRVKFIKAEVWDNQPDLSPQYLKKRYKLALKLYYDKQPTSLADLKQPSETLWGYMQQYKNFRINKYKSEKDPNRDWYVQLVDEAKELHSTVANTFSGCLGKTQTHTTGKGFGAHNIPQFAAHITHFSSSEMGVQLRIQEHKLDILLDKVQPVAKTGAVVYVDNGYAVEQ
jgi:hypothetical protein